MRAPIYSRLYVAQFECGLLKVGRSECVEKRRYQLRCDAPVKVGRIVRFFQSIPVKHPYRAEASVIFYAADRASERYKVEWFRGLDFDQIAMHASAVARQLRLKKKGLV